MADHVSEPENDADDLDIDDVQDEVSKTWEGKKIVPLLDELRTARAILRDISEGPHEVDVGNGVFAFCTPDDCGHLDECIWERARVLLKLLNGAA